MAPSIIIQEVSPHQPDVLELIRQLDENARAQYPIEACFLDAPEVLAKDNCLMIGAYIDKQLCGIGAVKFLDGYGEIKRMFVPPEFRGRKISDLILDRLLTIVKAKGLAKARLETGAKYTAAIGLYNKYGFKPCGRFGDYPENPHSLFMEAPVR